jgi:hypothetical protein
MKFNLKLLQYSLGVAVLFTTQGCQKFLEERNPSSFTQDGYYTKPEHAESAINAIYPATRTMGNSVGTYGGSNIMFLEFGTGLTNTNVNQMTDNVTIRTLAHNSDNAYVSQWWNLCFSGIANANLAIARIPDIPGLPDATLKKYLGEARFLRAFYYFYLVRIFGDVPLITIPVDATSPELYPARTPVAAVYDQIVADLTEAEQSGLPMRDATGRASLGAVKSLLAEVYLTMAGFPLNKGDSHYTLAANKAKELIDNGTFSLFQNYSDLHSVATENQGEHIFMVQYAASIADNNIQQRLLPNATDISSYSDEMGALFATREFINTYEAGDKRVQEQQFYFSKYPTNTNKSVITEFGEYFIYKHFDTLAHGGVVSTGTAISGLNWPLIRYAQVLLTYAEAQNEVGQNQSVYDAVNAIRKRASLADLSGLSKDDLRTAIWKERWHELAYENQTWFDMVRLRKAYSVQTNSFVDFVGYQFTYGPTLAEKHLLFPIPTSEMRNNPNLKNQNPGY